MNLRPHVRKRTAIGVLAALLTVAAVSSVASADQEQQARIPFSKAKILFELNATAQDAGIQVLLDGEGWDHVAVLGPDRGPLLELDADGSVGEIGITELFFESAEPSLADLPLDALFAMFPEGRYRFAGTTVASVDPRQGRESLPDAFASHVVEPAREALALPVE